VSSLAQTQNRLCDNWKALQQRWQTSRAFWNDPVNRGFEREYWQEFERVIPTTMDEMAKLAQLIAQAQRNVK